MTSPALESAPTRREANKERTREAVVAAAYALIATEGLDALSADRLAEAAGISRRTFFNYFPSVDAVLAHRAGQVSEQLQRAITSRPPSEPVVDSAIAVIDEIITTPMLREAVPVWRALEGAPAAARYALESKEQQVAEMADSLLQERFAGQPDSRLKAAVVTAVLLGAFEAARRTWLDALTGPVDDAARDRLVATARQAFLIARDDLVGTGCAPPAAEQPASPTVAAADRRAPLSPPGRV